MLRMQKILLPIKNYGTKGKQIHTSHLWTAVKSIRNQRLKYQTRNNLLRLEMYLLIIICDFNVFVIIVDV